MDFALQFDPARLPEWAEMYDDQAPADLNDVPEKAEAFMMEHGFLTKPLFVELGRWKSPRPTHHYRANPASFVEEVTRTALRTQSERLRIEALTLLQGVSWPTASVILHFGTGGEYPILDYRALWSLGVDPAPRYKFDVWDAYVDCCRDLAARSGLSIREVDKALWMYSKAHQSEAS